MQHNPVKILIVTSSYPPEIRSSSHLMQELAEELAVRGHQVCVATTYPSMNLADNMKAADYPEFSNENSVDVIRIKTGMHPHLKGNFFKRGISQLLLPYIFFNTIKKYVADDLDAVIVYSPPLTLSITGKKIKRKYAARFILNVQDIFPQNAIDLGIISNPAIVKFFEMIEKDAYRQADVITVHSEGNLNLLSGRPTFPANKATVLHNWVSIDSAKTFTDSNRYRRELNLVGKFVFFFGGVLGPSQGLDLLLKAAKQLEKYDEIRFLIAGDGLEKTRLENMARQMAIGNVIFHPFVSKDNYERLLTEIDVGLVCLSSQNKTPVVPGKILGYMAASVPVAALINRESDGHHIIREAGCGVSEVSDDPDRAVELLLSIYNDRDNLDQYGISGRNYAVRHFSKKGCVDKIEHSLI